MTYLQNAEEDDLDALERELLARQIQGSMLAAGKPSVGWNRKATQRRRAKNRVAKQSRRKNRAR